MANHELTSFEVDVLVDLALQGPTDGTAGWVPQPELAAALDVQVRLAAGLDPDRPHQPTGHALTVVAALKHCYYAGGAVADPDGYTTSPEEMAIASLQRYLLEQLPGWADAPWGLADAAHSGLSQAQPARASSGAHPGLPTPIHELQLHLGSAGRALVASDLPPSVLRPGHLHTGHLQDRQLLRDHAQSVPLLDVTYWSDLRTADDAFQLTRRQVERDAWKYRPEVQHRLFRFGRLLVTYRADDPGTVASAAALIPSTWQPDELWSPKEERGPGVPCQVLAEGVLLEPDETSVRGGMVVARDAAAISRIAESVRDGLVREQLRALDLSGRALVLLVGVAGAGEATLRVVDQKDGPLAEFTAQEETSWVGTLLVVPEMSAVPAQAVAVRSGVRFWQGRVDLED